MILDNYVVDVEVKKMSNIRIGKLRITTSIGNLFSTRERFTNFSFSLSDLSEVRRVVSFDQVLLCTKCRNHLDGIYTYIIWRLFDQGLLPDGFKMLCCICYEEEKKNDRNKYDLNLFDNSNEKRIPKCHFG